MKPIEFPEVNTVFGANQPQYQALPAYVEDGPEGRVFTVWELTDEEVDDLVKNRKLILTQLTFGNQFQPQLPIVFKSEEA